MALASNTRYLVLDDPEASDAVADKGQVIIQGDNDQTDFRYMDIAGPIQRDAAQAEQVREEDVTIDTVAANYEYWILITQKVDHSYLDGGAPSSQPANTSDQRSLEQWRFSVISDSSDDATSIRDKFIDKINDVGLIQVSAASQTTDTLRITANSGYPEFSVDIDGDNMSQTTNQSAQVPIGQGQDLVDMGLSEAETGNSYTRWWIPVFEKMDSAANNDFNTRKQNYIVYANDGGSSYSAFNTAMEDIFEPDTAGKLEDVTATYQP